MATCFVIQPFDGGPFDHRYDDVLEPAIAAAGLKAYRVDRDPKASIPIQDIERQIRNATVCLADISSPNPNVWFELGFAIAANKRVVLVCDEQVIKFPFDVQHRNIIRYRLGAPRDFEDMGRKITSRLAGEMEQAEAMDAAVDSLPIADIEGLPPIEVVALAAIGESAPTPESLTTPWSYQQEMERVGYTRFASSLAVRGLMGRMFVAIVEYEDDEGNKTNAYRITALGWGWIMRNQEVFSLEKPKRRLKTDEVPF